MYVVFWNDYKIFQAVSERTLNRKILKNNLPISSINY